MPSLSDQDAVDELRARLVFNKTLGEEGTQQTSTVRLLAAAGKGAKDLLPLAPSSICEELQERRLDFMEGVHLSEAKFTDYGDGGGIAHSDGTGKTDLTAAKMIVKPGAGGTLLTQGEDAKWRFVQITHEEFVLLPTTTGARLHCAARLVLVGEDPDGTLIFEAAGDARVLSIVMNIGPPERGENPSSFLEQATGFAEGYPEGVGPVRPPLPSVQLRARAQSKKARAWKARMAPERAALAMEAKAGSAATAAAKQAAAAEAEAAKAAKREAAAAKRAAAAAPLTSEEVLQQAQAEGLTLRVAKNKTGYFGVNRAPSSPTKPYYAQVTRGGKSAHLGYFVTAEEAALCLARSPEGKAAAAKGAPLTSEEARQQAAAEKLTLLVAKNKTGYFGVHLCGRPGQPKPYQAQVRRGGKTVSQGYFATAEEAALCVARNVSAREHGL